MTQDQLVYYLIAGPSAGSQEAILVLGDRDVMARINTEDERRTTGEAERAAEGETNV